MKARVKDRTDIFWSLNDRRFRGEMRFAPEMEEFCGKVIEVNSVRVPSDPHDRYRGVNWYWHPEWLELLPDEDTETTKDPKAEAGSKKDPMHLLPTVAMRSCARALKCGADKYGEYNWRTGDGIEANTYIAAIRRHLDDYVDGEDQDKESGESHLGHIMATCALLLDAERVGQLIDNRAKIEVTK